MSCFVLFCNKQKLLFTSLIEQKRKIINNKKNLQLKMTSIIKSLIFLVICTIFATTNSRSRITTGAAAQLSPQTTATNAREYNKIMMTTSNRNKRLLICLFA